MKISEAGVDLIKRFEGKELAAYQDIAGIWTIGYGHTGPDVKPGMKISDAEADDLLRKDLKPREDAVGRLVKTPLNQNEFDALVSFIYNVGENAFKNSTARARLNKGDRTGAAEAIGWWNKATVDGVLRPVAGLTRRRAAESALFLSPTNPPIVGDKSKVSENSRLTPIEDTPRRGNLAGSRTVQGATVAGGAGVAASTLGRNNAEELTKAGAPVTKTNGDTGASNATTTTTTTATETAKAPPMSLAEKHRADAQIQVALLILIVLAAFYVIFARIDDWLHFRR
ncbi:MAG TPA: lysozyme [Parvularculaceae bacterium]|nr:lysozyme [Parvularculaceae bacterium]